MGASRNRAGAAGSSRALSSRPQRQVPQSAALRSQQPVNPATTGQKLLPPPPAKRLLPPPAPAPRLQSGAGGKEVSGDEELAPHERPPTLHQYLNPYQGVQQASEHLQDSGIGRRLRKEILQSFDPGGMRLHQADERTYGMRYTGGQSQRKGRYLVPGPDFPADRESLALPPDNTMEGLAQLQVEEGSTYFSGRVAENFGHPGGKRQMFVPELAKLHDLGKGERPGRGPDDKERSRPDE